MQRVYICSVAFSILKWVKLKFHSELSFVFFHGKYCKSDITISELGGELISVGNYPLKCSLVC